MSPEQPWLDADTPTGAEIVRGAYPCAFDQSQPSQSDAGAVAFLSRLAPEVEFEPDASEPGVRAIVGKDRLRQTLNAAVETWDAYSYELAEVEELEDGRVIACGRILAWACGDDARVAISFANVWTLRERRGVRIQAYPDRASALEALGSG